MRTGCPDHSVCIRDATRPPSVQTLEDKVLKRVPGRDQWQQLFGLFANKQFEHIRYSALTARRGSSLSDQMRLKFTAR